MSSPSSSPSAHTADTASPLGKSAPFHGAVDVHAHYITPSLREAMIAAGHDHPDGMPAIPDWTARDALALMDATGVAVSMLSVSSPGVHLGDTARAVALARTVNEEGADLVAAHPDRFGLFASLPLPDVEAAVAEVAYAFDTLRADGIVLLTNYAGTYVGDPAFEPLMAELDRRRAVVLLHPTSPAGWRDTCLGRPRPMIEFPFDTTRAVAQLVLNKVLTNHPDIRFIIPHAGAALPVLADRVAAFAFLETDPPIDVVNALRTLHYDVAGLALPRALPALLELVGAERLLYGSDYPFTADWVVEGLAATLVTHDFLPSDGKQALLFENAARLFPRLSR
ncbi:amidohydrolase family protein [Streptomyces galbus]|uniref:amidohydrolase family protein n=1 Tax=Streptomyces galbus TaxID=33898 RepID=UPI00198A0047|nr:amidohydrolase family protein [Streptomyces galbus]GHD42368.1 amidohydrolase [Streptomyces galbus]